MFWLSTAAGFGLSIMEETLKVDPKAEPSKKGLISFAFLGLPTITTEKLNGKNYMGGYTVVEVWFLVQGLSNNLTKKAYDIDNKVRDEGQRADYQLVSLLWQSIDHKLMIHLCPYKTCYEVWGKARNIYANDIQRLYESVSSLPTLEMVDHDLSSYLNRTQSTTDELKLMLVSDDLQKVLTVEQA